MKQFLVTNLVTKCWVTVGLAEASAMTNLEPDEIVWALEEEGICETDRFVVTDYVEPTVPREGERRQPRIQLREYIVAR
jgi:hypothetical protein